jgi:hypothetical protein
MYPTLTPLGHARAVWACMAEVPLLHYCCLACCRQDMPYGSSWQNACCAPPTNGFKLFCHLTLYRAARPHWQTSTHCWPVLRGQQWGLETWLNLCMAPWRSHEPPRNHARCSKPLLQVFGTQLQPPPRGGSWVMLNGCKPWCLLTPSNLERPIMMKATITKQQ